MKNAIIIALLTIIVAASAPAAADYPVCATVKPPALLRSPESKVDYRAGRPFNDKGIN